ncbi:MAG: acetylglutamate kinase [Actinomycetales bacterium]|nr:acetylglutamate kinase [Actinomycetales bacterium]
MMVVKFGGHAMKDENGAFAQAIAAAQATGESVVVVHGGGPQIDAALKAKGIESSFVGGFRYTTPAIFEVVESVLVNEVGPKVAQILMQGGIKAQALSGRTLPTLIARRKTTLVDGSHTDLGHVGDVVRVDASALKEFVIKGIVPVVAPVSSDEDGDGGLNVNADLAAAAIAGALDASALIVMTDVAGIYRNWPDTSSLIESISSKELNSLKAGFSEGMAPKVQAALDALASGAKAVRIIDGMDPRSFADALLSKGGTLVTA